VERLTHTAKGPIPNFAGTETAQFAVVGEVWRRDDVEAGVQRARADHEQGLDIDAPGDTRSSATRAPRAKAPRRGSSGKNCVKRWSTGYDG